MNARVVGKYFLVLFYKRIISFGNYNNGCDVVDDEKLLHSGYYT